MVYFCSLVRSIQFYDSFDEKKNENKNVYEIDYYISKTKSARKDDEMIMLYYWDVHVLFTHNEWRMNFLSSKG